MGIEECSVRLVVQVLPLSQTSTKEAVLKSDPGTTEGHGMTNLSAMSQNETNIWEQILRGYMSLRLIVQVFHMSHGIRSWDILKAML